jgi:hypothetical protein
MGGGGPKKQGGLLNKLVDPFWLQDQDKKDKVHLHTSETKKQAKMVTN